MNHRSVSVVVLTGALLLASAGSAMAAKGGKQSLEGRLAWSIETTVSDPGDPSSPSNFTQEETTREEHSLQITAIRDRGFTRTYVFKTVKAPYSYTSTGTRITRDFSSSQLSCQITTTTDASGSGTVDVNPSLIGKYNGRKDVLVIDKRTKAISVGATLPATATITTTEQGFGISPCTGGTDTYTEDVRGSTSLSDSRNVCLPQGLSTPNSSYRPLFGKWNQKKKRFDFRCTATFDAGNFTTQKITVSGSLKYKR